MNALFHWIDERTGLVAAAGNWFQRPMAGGPGWRHVWPSTIAFGFVTEAVTGIVLWMYYSSGAQTAWESLYYLQSEVQGGWLLRAIHHYTAQVMLVLVGIYLVQMIVARAYRAPREFVYWSVVLMGLMVLALNLTGDLLAWDQNGFWSTRVRCGFLMLLPVGGNELFRLAAGGPAFGHLTLTRFVALHVGAFSAVFIALIALHAWLSYRLATRKAATDACTSTDCASRRYWPCQASHDAVACAVVLAVVLFLAFRHGPGGAEAGVGLGAPANPAEAYAAARPEWSFRGLFEFAHIFPAHLQILPIFVIPGVVVAIFLVMPFIGKRPLGQLFNVGFTLVLLTGLAILSFVSLRRDRHDEKYQAAVAAGQRDAHRVIVLAQSPQGIPVSGALTLLRNDAKTQGPRLFQQHCASCHSHSGEGLAEGEEIKAEKPSAPNLRGYASRRWIAGLLDAQQIKGPHYFGDTKFKAGKMAGFVKESLAGLDSGEKKELERGVMALSAEAGLKAQRRDDATAADQIAKGKQVLSGTFDCTSCHRFHDKGQLGDAPDLTGYGSREWIIGIISNPGDKRFYGKGNDRMPAYAESPHEPAKNILSAHDIEMLADWLRGEWYEE